MKFLAKFLKNLYMGFRATLKFWKFKVALNTMFGRCDFLIVSVLDSRASSLGLSPGQGRWVVFLGKILARYLGKALSQCLSLPRGVNGYQHPIQEGEEILLVASCYWNQDKLRPDEPFGSFADFTWTLCTEFLLSHPRKITGDAKKADFPSSIYKLKVWS